MATPAPQRDPRDNQQGNNSDSEDENDPSRDIPLLYVPDLANTILSKAIKDGIQVGNSGTEYIIPTPLLKDIVGVEWLKVTLPKRRTGNMFWPSPRLCHQVPTGTL